MGEFEFIAEHLARLAGDEALDLKDDVALWTPPVGYDVVLSMDTLVEGVHFPMGQFDAQLAQKLIRVNVSDIVAKGATPVGYLLSLCLPKNVDEVALKSFCKGLDMDQAKYNMKLWGGDTTRTKSNCVLSLTIIATTRENQAILRSTANIGDVICVTGTIGDAWLGLQIVQGQISENADLRTSYYLPSPPYEARPFIRKYASAALDISDGLIADATHLAKASGVKLEIDISTVPFSTAAQEWLNYQSDLVQARIGLCTGGDDYQTLMTMSEQAFDEAVSSGLQVTKIGHVVSGAGVVCHDGHGNTLAIDKVGYTHF